MRNEHIPVCLSLGVIARNAESSIKTALESLFQQSIFVKLSACGGQCEILCLAYACTDRTAEIAREVFDRMERLHAHPQAFTARVAEIPQPAGSNAWNLFVHEFSAPEARYLCVMDDDAVFYDPDTIYNLAGTLERNLSANVSAASRHKDVLFRPCRIPPSIPGTTGGHGRRSDGQLYCMRASVARRIHPPRDPGLVDDGFLRSAFCTDFFMHTPDASRIIFMPDGAPVVPPHAPLRAKTPPVTERAAPVESSRRDEKRDSIWQNIRRRHRVRMRFFRLLVPGLVAFPLKSLWKRRSRRKVVVHLSAMPAGFVSRSPGGRPFDSLKGKEWVGH